MREQVPFGYIFLAGLIAGILIMNFGKSILPENTGLLDEDTLYHMKDMTVDGGALFVFVLRKRLGAAVMAAVMATTYLGLLFCAGAAFWYGLSAGVFVSAAVWRFGIKGILLAFAATLPQYLVYLPAFYALFVWCEGTYRCIYLKNRYPEQIKTPAIPKRVLKFLVIFAAVLLGCALESFANPTILSSFLQVL